MGEPLEQFASAIDVDLVAPQFDALDSATHRSALREATWGIDASLPEDSPEAWFTIAPAEELPIERGDAGPGLLVNVCARRFGRRPLTFSVRGRR